jgi:hypothetical protein
VANANHGASVPGDAMAPVVLIDGDWDLWRQASERSEVTTTNRRESKRGRSSPCGEKNDSGGFNHSGSDGWFGQEDKGARWGHARFLVRGKGTQGKNSTKVGASGLLRRGSVREKQWGRGSEGVHVLAAGGALGPTDGRRWATTARTQWPRVAAASTRDTGAIQAGEKRVADA